MRDARCAGDVHDVLFLCTGNAGRSIIAEAILNRIGAPRFRAWSAGSRPKGRVHPEALRLLLRLGLDTQHLRSKSWDEFTGDWPIAFDTVITVCNNVAGEVCPAFPGHPAKVHWDVPDPSAVSGDQAQIEQAFEDVHALLTARIRAFLQEQAT